jgi:hypothetical protein
MSPRELLLQNCLRYFLDHGVANLHAQGILSDEEYTAAKAKALGI